MVCMIADRRCLAVEGWSTQEKIPCHSIGAAGVGEFFLASSSAQGWTASSHQTPRNEWRY